MGIDAQIAYITSGYGKVQPLEEIDVDMRDKKMSKTCKCLTCPFFNINYNFGLMIMNCFYSGGKKDSVIFNIDTNKGTPEKCPLKEKENG